jgi:15-cis-phytoene synthase
MQDPFDHCEQVVRETDKDRFLATLFAPANRRGLLFALYAFNSEIARVREAIRDPMAGEIRLQWWRDALERPGSGDARANPIASALLNAVIRFQLPVQSLMAVIEAREFDLYRDPMPTLAALEAYAEKTSSTLIDLAATILGARAPDISPAVREGGLAYAITGLLRAFPLHAARGQLYVPLDILERHGAKPEDIFAGRASPEVSAALAALRRIAQGHYDAYAQAAPTVAPAAAPAFLPLALVPLYLKRLERFGQSPFHVVDVPQWRRQWVLWRAARRIP